MRKASRSSRIRSRLRQALSAGGGSWSSTLRRTHGIALSRVELGADGVELASGLVDDADGDEVDRGAVLDELGVVEEAPHARHRSGVGRPAPPAPRSRRSLRCSRGCRRPTCPMPVLAIDAGTTGVTALVVGEDGDVLARGYREFAQLFPRPGWVEHEPDDIWTATVAACREALAGTDAAAHLRRDHRPARDRRRLGPAHPALPAPGDRLAGPPHHRHLRPAARRRRRAAGRRAAPACGWTRTSPAPSSPGSPSTSRRCGPASADGALALGTVDSYVIARLTGGAAHVTDPSNASRTLLYDLEKGAWSDELCDLFDVPRSALPEVVPSSGVVGTTDPDAFLGPRAADRRDRRRPAGRPVRPGLLLPRHEQVHLRHGLVRAHQHRDDAGALGRRPAHHRRLGPRRRAGLRARGRDLRDRRRGAVAARRARADRLRRRDRGAGPHGARLRRRRLRARADRAGRAALGPARPRRDPRPHPRHHPGAPRPGDAGGDRVRGARRRRRHGRRGRAGGAGAVGRRRRQRQRPAHAAAGRPARRAGPPSGGHRDDGARARPSWPGSAPASGARPTSWRRPGRWTGGSSPRPDGGTTAGTTAGATPSAAPAAGRASSAASNVRRKAGFRRSWPRPMARIRSVRQGSVRDRGTPARCVRLLQPSWRRVLPARRALTAARTAARLVQRGRRDRWPHGAWRNHDAAHPRSRGGP